MIVSLKYISYQSAGYASSIDLALSEVETEEEAFGEMRRFLQVNDIDSDVTYVEMIEQHEYAGRIVPRHKQIDMYQKGYVPHDARKVEGIAFGIYYGSDKPKHEQLGSIEDWGLCHKKDWGTGGIYLVPKSHSPSEIATGEWYNCVKRYLDDLAQRKAGV